MSAHACTEDQLVEQPAIRLFSELGWATVSALEETFGAPSPGLSATLSHPMGEGASLGRETKGEVVLVSRLRAALERLNPALPPEAITAAVDELTLDRSAMSLPAANRKIYTLIKDGIRVSIAQPEDSPSSPALLPGGEGSSAAPSTSGRGTKGEGRGGDSSRRDSGGQRTERVRVIDLVEYFSLFSEHKAGLVKIIGQNHQFLGVNNAIASMLAARKLGHGRGGVFWQTPGSGKSFSMVFFAQKVLRKVAGNWTFVVVTDRVELDDQIAKTFKATGAVSEAEGDQCHAASGAHLRELLRGNHRYVFTLIHKFRPENLLPLPAKNERGEDRGEGLPVRESPLSDSLPTRASRGERENGVMPVLCDRPDVIVLTDEAHRSQYDTLALNVRAALPKALFLAFTGTPLIAGEERTKDVFGDLASQARHQSVSPSEDSRSRASWSFPSTTSSNPSRTARPCRSFTRTARRSCSSKTRT